tara:strand:- start:266 stop:751 length:486 start_codon:yes stop_codon:yes gene_type:complete
MEKKFFKSIFSFGLIFSSAVQPVIAKDYLIAHGMVKKSVIAVYYPTQCRRVKTVKNQRGDILERVVTKGVKCPQPSTPHFRRKGTFTNHGGSNMNHNHNHDHNHNYKASKKDNNSCKEGSIIGGLLGAGVTMSATRGKDRWWAVPAGGAAGAMIGCQIDGG